jgi:ribonuclease T1
MPRGPTADDRALRHPTAPAALGWPALMHGSRIPRALLLLVLGALVALVAVDTPRTSAANAVPGTERQTEVPQKARDVLAEIQKRNGEPPPGYVGGRTFANREHRLPRGKYREYDVNPKIRGKNRGTERIVIEQRTRKAYYSRDHYETFVPMD